MMHLHSETLVRALSSGIKWNCLESFLQIRSTSGSTELKYDLLQRIKSFSVLAVNKHCADVYFCFLFFSEILDLSVPMSFCCGWFHWSYRTQSCKRNGAHNVGQTTAHMLFIYFSHAWEKNGQNAIYFCIFKRNIARIAIYARNDFLEFMKRVRAIVQNAMNRTHFLHTLLYENRQGRFC